MKDWIQAARIYVVSASILPAVYGSLLAYNETGVFRLWIFILTVVGVSLIHFAANLFNDYYDFKSGVDLDNPEGAFPFSGGSRVIVEGRISPEKVFGAAVICSAAASAIGILLAFAAGPFILLLGVIGVSTSILYVHPRFSLINKGIGELVVGLDFGVLTVSGAYYAQTGVFSLSEVMASIPVGLIIAAILIVNEFPDYAGDLKAGKRTIVVRLGKRKASIFLASILALTVLMIPVNIAAGFIGMASIASLLALPFIINAMVKALKHFNSVQEMLPANISVVNSHMFINSYLAAACLYMVGSRVVCIILVALILAYQISVMNKLKLLSFIKRSKSDTILEEA
ncbi:MAG: prenyltransferase [Clostridiales bacterium]|nr:prenyltransferase [Clostridiales bacterium]